MLKEFREFAVRGNVVDMAVGIIIGAAFGAVVKSMVDDLLMPPVGLLLGGVDFTNLFATLREGKTPAPYATLGQAKEAGAVTVNYGAFVNNVVSFLIVAFAVFLVVRAVNALRRKQEPAPAAATTKDCPFCTTAIPIKATRCPHCTSDLAARRA
jgi:large conductance mechanosensitive channel